MNWKLVLVRHAESEANIIRRDGFLLDEYVDVGATLSSHDVWLTEKWLQQAKTTWKALYTIFGEFDRIYCSPLKRTRQTLHHMLDHMPIRSSNPVVEDIRLREKESWYHFNMTKKQSIGYFPWRDSYYNANNPIYVIPPWGESLAQLTDRVYSFVDSVLYPAESGLTTLVLTHGHAIKGFRHILEWISIEDALSAPAVSNCATLSYDICDGGYILDSWPVIHY